jgi:hypothetical protein
MPHCRSSFLAVVFMMPVWAQDPPSATKSATTNGQHPALVLKTGDPVVAMQTALLLGHIDDLPELPEGGHFVLSLGTDQQLAVTVGAGAAALVDLVADPAALMAIYAEELEGVLPVLRGSLTIGMQESGLQPKDAARMVKDVLAFPKQLQKVTLKVVGGPDSVDGSRVQLFGQHSIEATLAVEGKPGSGFEQFVGLCKPSPKGAPVLPATDAAMSLSFSLAPESLALMQAPFRELALTMSTQDDAQRDAYGAIYDQWLALDDGGFAMTFGTSMQMNMLIAVLDTAKLREILTSETYLSMMRSQNLPDPDVTIEVSPGALAHRGSQFLRYSLRGGEPGPVISTGDMDVYLGTVADYMAMSAGADEAGIRALVDAVLDQKVRRAPLSGDSIFQFDLDLVAFAQLVNPASGQGDVDHRMPERMTMSAAAIGKALQFRMSLK